MKKQIQQRDFTLKSTKSQQLELAVGATYIIPDDAPVRKLWEVLEGMKITQVLHEVRSSTANKLEKTAIWVFGAMNGIYSSRKLEEACRNDIRYMWLLDGKKVPDHTSLSRFRKDELSGILEEIFPQLLDYLNKTGETDEETVFIDGTKIEANANRYSFVWRKSVEKQQIKLKEKAEGLLENHTIEGLRTLASELMQGINPVHGSGRRKSDEQKESEKITQIAKKLEQYQMSLDIMGEDRNSYSKTDHDATFMRMKDDHMRNGQLKAAYNLQLAVNSEYIVGYGVFSNRTDSGALIPLLDNMHGRYASVTADAGYESFENYSYLEKNDIISYIKPTNYERRKKKSSWIGRLENMVYDADTDSFTCKNSKTLRYDGMRSRKSGTGFERKTSLYVCRVHRKKPYLMIMPTQLKILAQNSVFAKNGAKRLSPICSSSWPL